MYTNVPSLLNLPAPLLSHPSPGGRDRARSRAPGAVRLPAGCLFMMVVYTSQFYSLSGICVSSSLTHSPLPPHPHIRFLHLHKQQILDCCA